MADDSDDSDVSELVERIHVEGAKEIDEAGSFEEIAEQLRRTPLMDGLARQARTPRELDVRTIRDVDQMARRVDSLINDLRAFRDTIEHESERRDREDHR